MTLAPAPSALPSTMSADDIIDACKRYTLFEWGSQQVQPLAIGEARGCWMHTVDGRRFLDFNSISMNVNIGHGDRRVADAVARQVATAECVSPFMATEVRARVGEHLARITPPGLTKSFFTLAGADANEAAIRTARLVTGRPKILTRYRSYHGGTGQTLAISGDPRRWPVEPGMGDIARIPDPYHYQSAIDDPIEFRDANLAAIEEIVRLEGPHTIAAIMIEPVTGSNGLIVPPTGWLSGVRRICDHYGILLVCDEVMSGFGRTGRWFAVDHEDVSPDIMTVAKGITCGYVPLGACIVSDEIAAAMHDRPFASGLTYQSHPVGLAAAEATLAIYESDGLIERSATMGTRLRAGLDALRDRHPSVGDVRSIGLFSTLELVHDRTTRGQLFSLTGAPDPVTTAMKAALIEHGVFANLRGPYLYANPPLTIDDDEMAIGLAALDAALDIADMATSANGAPPPEHLAGADLTGLPA